MKQGFSLVELSIVLVILGLLVGGVLTGQSLIRAAELRSISTDTEKFRAATYTFRDKYFQLPGDMNNATSFWGVLAGTGSDATCQDTAATGTATCNGNGDGIVSTNVVAYSERFRFFQHLANAGLIEGSYTGKTDDATSGSYIVTAGINSPRLKANGMFTVVYKYSGVTGAGVFDFDGITAGTYFEYRDMNTDTNLSPEEAWNLDTKLDDGRPGYGVFYGPQNTWTGSVGCTTTDDPATSAYSLTNTGKICRFNFRI